eukprot:3646338-Rhodomonas_salina.1
MPVPGNQGFQVGLRPPAPRRHWQPLSGPATTTDRSESVDVKHASVTGTSRCLTIDALAAPRLDVYRDKADSELDWQPEADFPSLTGRLAARGLASTSCTVTLRCCSSQGCSFRSFPPTGRPTPQLLVFKFRGPRLVLLSV